MGIALAAPVPGRRHAHQFGVQPVLHVPDEDAVLDQHVALRRGALVVDVDRAAPTGNRPVIDDRHALGGDALAHLVREGARLLAVEVAFEAVSDRLVEEDSGPAGAEDHVHRASGACLGLEVQECDAHRLVDEALPARRVTHLFELEAAASPLIADFASAAIGGEDLDVHAHERQNVRHSRAVARGDLHLPRDL